MALASIGTATLDFDTKTPVLLPPVGLRDDRGYMFFIRTTPASTETTNQYVNVIATFDSDEGRIETPLLAKFFPKGLMMGFAVTVPALDFWNNPSCQILLLPREFFPDSGSVRQLPIEVLWEDDIDYRLTEMSIFAGT